MVVKDKYVSMYMDSCNSNKEESSPQNGCDSDNFVQYIMYMAVFFPFS